MPFSFAHPAASIPLYRPLRRLGVLSALVIGSIAPDIIFFVPMGIFRSQSHSPAGILWFCLPGGLLSYIIFHKFLKGPLLSLLPDQIFSRLGDYARQYKSLPSAPWQAVIVSLLCGTLTHLFWDSFTHWDGYAVSKLPVLKSYVFSIAGYPVYLLKLLQQVSTCFGLILIGYWIWQWYKSALLNLHPLPVMLPQHRRYTVVAIMGIAPLMVGLAFGLLALNAHPKGLALKVFSSGVVSSTLPAFLLALIGYSIFWHIWKQKTRNSK